jgi:hypothetical protein
MKKSLQERPLFLFLLPVFFVWHGYVENYYFMRFSECLPLFGLYTCAAILLYLIARLTLKDKIGAALYASFIMAIYLFFGALHDFLRKNNILLHRYVLLLPCLLAVAAGLFIYLKKRSPISKNRRSSIYRSALFLNLLLLLYILVDGVSLAGKLLHKNADRTAGFTFIPGTMTRCDSCPKPDIYFILFDDYSGSKTLKTEFQYDNSRFDSFLVREGFQIQANSRSNYNHTPFSMASILNFAYLEHPEQINPDDFTGMLDLIGRNRVVDFLYARGYSVVNYSPFDVQGHPSQREIPYLPAKAKLIADRTLFNYMMKDLYLWIWLEGHLKDSATLAKNHISEIGRMNRQFLDGTKAESAKRSTSPRFIYTHLYMPHYPFYYDSLLHRRRSLDIVTHQDEQHPEYYLEYLPYTNACAEDLISTIKKNSNGQAVIIFMSDHGYRYFSSGKSPSSIFNNQNAVYFPDKDYHLFYDSISGVNEFRVIFNKLFRQNFPILKDSVLFLKNKE